MGLASGKKKLNYKNILSSIKECFFLQRRKREYGDRTMDTEERQTDIGVERVKGWAKKHPGVLSPDDIFISTNVDEVPSQWAPDGETLPRS